MICSKCVKKEESKARLEKAVMFLVMHGLDLGPSAQRLSSNDRKLRLVFESDFQELRKAYKAKFKAEKGAAR